MANFRNSLSYNVPIVDAHGRPTPEFMSKWQQQSKINGDIPAAISTPEQVSAILDLLAATPGALLRRGAAQWQALNSLGDATKFLNGAGAYSPPVPLNAKGQVLGTTGAALGALAPGVDSQVLTADAAQPLGFKWAPAGGGGGGGYWSFPKIADFDIYDLSGLSTYRQSQDGISILHPNTFSRPLAVMHKSPLPANWVFEAELQNGILSANFQAVHVGVGAASDQSQFSTGLTNNVSWWRHKLTGGLTSGVATESLGTTVPSLSSPTTGYAGVTYAVRVTCTSGILTFALSVDGGNTYRDFHTVALSVAYSAVPADLRVLVAMSNSSSQPIATLFKGYRLQLLP